MDNRYTLAIYYIRFRKIGETSWQSAKIQNKYNEEVTYIDCEAKGFFNLNSTGSYEIKVLSYFNHIIGPYFDSDKSIITGELISDNGGAESINSIIISNDESLHGFY